MDRLGQQVRLEGRLDQQEALELQTLDQLVQQVCEGLGQLVSRVQQDM
jgi:hypothetical protein